MNNTNIIEVKNLKSYLGNNWVHNGVNLTVKRGEVLAIMGGSGTGKTVLLREMLLLRRPDAGSIHIFNKDLLTASSETLLGIQQRWGVLFQQNALFSSLTVLENTAFPLKEHTDLDEKTIEHLALLKILLAGLTVDAANKYPSELSGGMQKRAALARAIALDPELLFLDEPTSGLDPANVLAFDHLILDLQTTMGLTIVMVTHDVESMRRVSNRLAFLGDGKVLAIGPADEVINNSNSLVQDFFNDNKQDT